MYHALFPIPYILIIAEFVFIYPPFLSHAFTMVYAYIPRSTVEPLQSVLAPLALSSSVHLLTTISSFLSLNTTSLSTSSQPSFPHSPPPHNHLFLTLHLLTTIFSSLSTSSQPSFPHSPPPHNHLFLTLHLLTTISSFLSTQHTGHLLGL